MKGKKGMRKIASWIMTIMMILSMYQPMVTEAAQTPSDTKGGFGTFTSCSVSEETMQSADYYRRVTTEDLHTYIENSKDLWMPQVASESTEDTGLFKSQLTGKALEMYNGIESAGISGSKNAVTVNYTIGSNETLQGAADAIDSAFEMFFHAYELDHMDQMYFQYHNDGSLSIQGSGNTLRITIEFTKGQGYSTSLENQAKSKLSECVNQAKQKSHIYDQLAVVNQWICDNCVYNDLAAENQVSEEESYYAHSAMGLLTKGSGVCETYAKTLKLACMQLGIKCVPVLSKTHMFNYVRMDDGKWYMIDSTWNDSSGSDRYLLVSNNKAIDSDHTESSPLHFPKTETKAYEKTQEHTHTIVTDSAVAASCTEAGKTEGSHCSDCGEIIKEQQTVAALGHSYDNGIVTKEASCKEKGSKQYTCSRCSETKEEEIPLDSGKHTGNTEIKNKKEATETQEGYTGDTCCADCGMILTYGSVIPMLVPEHTHTIITDPAIAATCTEAGKTEGSHCSDCGEIIKEQQTVAALGHSYDNGIVTKEASCKEKGSKQYTCSRCSEIKIEEIPLDSSKHTGNTEIKNKKEATETQEGYTGDTCCADCGTILVYGTILPMIEPGHIHTEVVDAAVEPTCTEAGKTEGSHCASCGASLRHQQPLPALGHDEVSLKIKASLTEDGCLGSRCTRCEKVFDLIQISYPKTIKLSTTSYTYDGKVKKPSVSVINAEGQKISSSNYTVTYASGRKAIGKYNVKVVFKGNYTGTKNLTFKINPVKTSITSIKKGKNAFTVKWSKKTKNVTGYQIQYSTKSDFSDNVKTVKITKNKTVSKTIKGLTAQKKYYVRVRTYKTVSKTNYYSGWSSKKSVTTAGTVKKAAEQSGSGNKTASNNVVNNGNASAGAVVYVTPTGSKYHSKPCGNGNYSKTSLEEAKKRGLTACSKCY